MRATFATLTALAMLASAPAAQTKTSKPLDIYLMDAEGGKAVLLVSPSGETVLIDTANPVARDTDRIMAMLTEAGVKQIDYLILDALPRRPRRRLAGTGQARPDQALRRPRSERRGARAGRRLPGRLRRALRQGQAHRRQARRQAAGGRTGLAHRDLGRQGDHDAAPRCAESPTPRARASRRTTPVRPTTMASRWEASSRSESSG